MRIPAIFLVAFLPLMATAQSNKGYNRINLSYNWQSYLNKQYVENDTKGPSHPLHAHNTFGYNYALEFERTTRHGIILNAGIQYGIQRHNVDIIRDLSNFDSDAVNNLNGTVYRDNIRSTHHYISPRLMLGYRKSINNKWAVSGKIGLSKKMFLDGKSGGNPSPVLVSYEVDDQSQDRTNGFIAYQYSLGDERPTNSRRLFHRTVSTYELAVGIERNLNNKYIKHLYLGFEANRNMSINSHAGQFIQVISRETVDQTDQSQMNVDWYNNKNLSLGLRLGIGLWK